MEEGGRNQKGSTTQEEHGVPQRKDPCLRCLLAWPLTAQAGRSKSPSPCPDCLHSPGNFRARPLLWKCVGTACALLYTHTDYLLLLACFANMKVETMIITSP